MIHQLRRAKKKKDTKRIKKEGKKEGEQNSWSSKVHKFRRELKCQWHLMARVRTHVGEIWISINLFTEWRDNICTGQSCQQLHHELSVPVLPEPKHPQIMAKEREGRRG